MKIIETEDYEELSRLAAARLADAVAAKPDCVLGLATGSTPVGAYSRLCRLHREQGLDFSRVHTVNLDEYIGLPPEDPRSYRSFMQKYLFDGIAIPPENTHLPDGMTIATADECIRYDRLIDMLGGMDLQLLGIGRNGHIGFNEPADVFLPDTHVTVLSRSTIEANKRFFASEREVPRQAITMGVGAIMRARSILLLASGEDKAEGLRRALVRRVDPQVPASILHLHPDVTLIADRAALSQLG